MKLRLVIALYLLTGIASEAMAEPEIALESEGSPRALHCEPSARLSGEGALVSQLSDELASLGVSLEAVAACPIAEASIETIANGYFVSIRDLSGRNAYRSLGDLRVAATWIDSWLRDDLAAPLLEIRAVAPEFSAAPAPALAAPLQLEKPASNTPPERLWSASLLYESATASDAADWQGGRADLCRELSIGCFGLTIRVAERSSPNTSGDGYSVFSQSAFDLMAALRVPVAVGRSTLSPRLGVGMGRIRADRSSDPFCILPVDEAGNDCLSSVAGDEPDSQISWAPRAEVGVSLSIPISSSTSIELGSSADLRPLGAHARVVEEFDVPPPPMPMCPGNDPTEPDCIDEPFTLVAMPADPEYFWRFSIGLQVRL